MRMLAGAPENGQPIAETLKAAQDAIAAGGGHWVDTFHQYGVGADLGLLRKQGLPTGVLNDTDWNLRREAVELDIRAQVPKLDTGAPGGDGYCLVNDADFWNGCVMARWGAYWNESARPDDWSADDRDNWPATKAVDAWSSGSEGLPAGTPLHLADAPPDADDPHTLFTAYSWPDRAHRGHRRLPAGSRIEPVGRRARRSPGIRTGICREPAGLPAPGRQRLVGRGHSTRHGDLSHQSDHAADGRSGRRTPGGERTRDHGLQPVQSGERDLSEPGCRVGLANHIAALATGLAGRGLPERGAPGRILRTGRGAGCLPARQQVDSDHFRWRKLSARNLSHTAETTGSLANRLNLGRKRVLQLRRPRISSKLPRHLD